MNKVELENRLFQMEMACKELVNFPDSVHYDSGPLYTLFCEIEAIRRMLQGVDDPRLDDLIPGTPRSAW